METEDEPEWTQSYDFSAVESNHATGVPTDLTSGTRSTLPPPAADPAAPLPLPAHHRPSESEAGDDLSPMRRQSRDSATTTGSFTTWRADDGELSVYGSTRMPAGTHVLETVSSGLQMESVNSGDGEAMPFPCLSPMDGRPLSSPPRDSMESRESNDFDLSQRAPSGEVASTVATTAEELLHRILPPHVASALKEGTMSTPMRDNPRWRAS